jgi:hypothetical protein
MDKDTITMLVPITAIVIYLIIHISLWRGQDQELK